MKIENRIKGLLVLAAISLAVILYFVQYYFSVIDTKGVKIEGYVYDDITKQPLNNVMVTINNERYEDDKGNKNYDEYLGHDKVIVYTDDKGYYSSELKKSAYVWTEFRKNGYVSKSLPGEYSTKRMDNTIYLQKVK